MGIRTHYDNLQVVQTASPEVIKGAYRYLTQRWHPDRNPDNRAEAERITRLVNEAYRVLSDPDLRKAHDAWIATQGRGAGARGTGDPPEPPQETPPEPTPRPHHPRAAGAPRAGKPGVLWWSVMLLLSVGAVYLVDGYWLLVLVVSWGIWVLTRAFDRAARVLILFSVAGAWILLATLLDESRPHRAPVPVHAEGVSRPVDPDWDRVALAWERKHADFLSHPGRAETMKREINAVLAVEPNLPPHEVFRQAEARAFAYTSWPPGTPRRDRTRELTRPTH